MEIKSTEFFKNFKTLPPVGSQDFLDLLEWEKEKLTRGVTVQGVYFSGWLYWHLNHWWIGIDQDDGFGNISPKPFLAELRDNEWERAESILDCQKEKLGYIEVGQRRSGKTEFLASYLMYNTTLFENTQNAIITGNSNDQAVIIQKVDFGYPRIWEGIKIDKLDKGWNKSYTRFGYKDQLGEDHIWSSLAIRNADGGKNTEVAAGLTLKTFILDEIGKFDFGQVITSAKPTLMTQTGWRGIPLLTGCVCAGTKITTREGAIVNIEDLKKEDGIIGYNGFQSCVENIEYIKEPVEKECVRITTTSGNFIECSTDHPFLSGGKERSSVKGVLNTNKAYFRKASDLMVGDRLYKSLNNEIFGNFKDSDAYLIGFLIGDGYYANGCEVYSSNEEVSDFISSRYKTKVTKEFITRNNRTYKTLYISGMVGKTKEYGMYGQSKFNKRVPNIVNRYDKESLCQFLAGYFDADGHIKTSKNPSKEAVVLTSVVWELLESVKYLLLKLGIVSHILKEKRNTKSAKGFEGRQPFIYRLYISKSFSLNIFKNLISLKDSNKRKALSEIKGRQRTYGVCKAYYIPSNDPELSSTIKEGFLENVCFENIKSIENIGLKLVYNLRVSNTKTYIANGFITHNTGGAFEKGKDAERYFNNPERNLFKGYKDPDTGKITGKFISGLYRMDCKEESNLADYLIKHRGQTFTKSQYRDLSKIKMFVSDKEKALEKINKERALKKLDPDRTEYLKEIMYFPITVDECFLTEGVNMFNEVEAKRQKDFLLSTGKYRGDRVILREGHEGIDCEIVLDERIAPISTFPLSENESKDGCIIIYEHPPKNAPFGMYVGGVDPYKQDQASYSDSLGAVYIFKRLHDITSEKYQDMIVAQYVGRPDSIDTWCENARLLIKYYNALTFVENEDIYFIKYIQARFEDFYLADEQPFIKALVPTSTVNRGKGFHAVAKIINFLNTNLKAYTEEVEAQDRDDDGNVIKTYLGMSKILDIMLLEELIKFRPGGNYDRIRAASAAITLARNLDPYLKVDNVVDQQRKSHEKEKKKFKQASSLSLRKNKVRF